MNYANVGGEPVDLDDPDECPPWYDPDAMHARAVNRGEIPVDMRPATAPRVPFTWRGLIGQRVTLTTADAIYRDAEVIDYHEIDRGGWIEIVYDPPRSPVTGKVMRPAVHGLVNLAHVRSIRLPA